MCPMPEKCMLSIQFFLPMITFCAMLRLAFAPVQAGTALGAGARTLILHAFWGEDLDAFKSSFCQELSVCFDQLWQGHEEIDKAIRRMEKEIKKFLTTSKTSCVWLISWTTSLSKNWRKNPTMKADLKLWRNEKNGLNPLDTIRKQICWDWSANCHRRKETFISNGRLLLQNYVKKFGLNEGVETSTVS